MFSAELTLILMYKWLRSGSFFSVLTPPEGNGKIVHLCSGLPCSSSLVHIQSSHVIALPCLPKPLAGHPDKATSSWIKKNTHSSAEDSCRTSSWLVMTCLHPERQKFQDVSTTEKFRVCKVNLTKLNRLSQAQPGSPCRAGWLWEVWPSGFQDDRTSTPSGISNPSGLAGPSNAGNDQKWWTTRVNTVNPLKLRIAAAPAPGLEVLRPLGRKMWDDQRPTVQIRSNLAPIAVKRRWAWTFANSRLPMSHISIWFITQTAVRLTTEPSSPRADPVWGNTIQHPCQWKLTSQIDQNGNWAKHGQRGQANQCDHGFRAPLVFGSGGAAALCNERVRFTCRTW